MAGAPGVTRMRGTISQHFSSSKADRSQEHQRFFFLHHEHRHFSTVRSLVSRPFEHRSSCSDKGHLAGGPARGTRSVSTVRTSDHTQQDCALHQLQTRTQPTLKRPRPPPAQRLRVLNVVRPPSAASLGTRASVATRVAGTGMHAFTVGESTQCYGVPPFGMRRRASLVATPRRSRRHAGCRPLPVQVPILMRCGIA